MNSSTAREVSADSMTGIISQTYTNLLEVESRLKNTISRLSPNNSKNIEGLKPSPTVANGLLNSAQEVRAIASHILDHCTTLDNLL